MIVRAPCFVYPRTVQGLFNADTPGIIEKPNYQIGPVGMKCRFIDLVDAGTDIAPAGAAYDPFPGQDIYVQDANCHSYKFIKKPSNASLRFEIRMNDGNYLSTAGPLLDPLISDMAVSRFGDKFEPLDRRQIYGKVFADGVDWFLMALGTWFQFRMAATGTNIGGNVYEHTVFLSVERECRIYLESINFSPAQSPTFAVVGGGQYFPVVIPTSTATSLSCSQGGMITRGGSKNEFKLQVSRSVTTGLAQFFLRIDLEVPYGL